MSSLAHWVESRFLLGLALPVIVGCTTESAIPIVDKPKEELRCFAGHRSPIKRLLVSRDGRRLISSDEAHQVRVWDVATAKELCCLSDIPRPSIETMVVSPDGRHLLTNEPGPEVHRNGRLSLLDLGSGEKVREIDCPAGIPGGVAFSPDGTRVLSGHDLPSPRSGTYPMCLWEVETGKELKRYQVRFTPIAVFFGPDGRRPVLLGKDRLIRVWDLDADKELSSFHLDQEGAAFSADGSRVMTVAGLMTKVWDTGMGKPLRQLEVAKYVGDRYDSHAYARGSFALSPDGRRALFALRHNHTVYKRPPAGAPTSAGSDPVQLSWTSESTLRLWDIESGKELASFAKLEEIRPILTFAPDGRHVFIGEASGLIRLWELPK